MSYHHKVLTASGLEARAWALTLNHGYRAWCRNLESGRLPQTRAQTVMLVMELMITISPLSTALALPALSQVPSSTWVHAVRSFATYHDTDSQRPAPHESKLEDSETVSEKGAAASEQGVAAGEQGAAVKPEQGAGNDAAKNALKHTTSSGMRSTPLCRLTGLCGRTATRIIDTNMRCPVCLMDRRDRPTTFFPAVSIDQTVRLQHSAAGAAASNVWRSTNPAFVISNVYPSFTNAHNFTRSNTGQSCSRSSIAACGASVIPPTHIAAHRAQARLSGAGGSVTAPWKGFAPSGLLQRGQRPAASLPPAALEQLSFGCGRGKAYPRGISSKLIVDRAGAWGAK